LSEDGSEDEDRDVEIIDQEVQGEGEGGHSEVAT
jgi:hypothetical protein